MLTPVTFPPGMLQNGTDLKTQGRWRNGNFIRWVEGVMQPVGRWRKITQNPFSERVGGLIAIRDHTFRKHLFIGTSSEVYVVFSGSELRDITPADLEPGRDFTEVGAGYGAGPYGEEEYGTPRGAETSLSLEANNWSFDRWGEFLVATNIADGRAFYWEPGDLATPADTELQVIPNAPVDNRALIVTNERHLMLLGAGGDPQKVQWSVREDFTDWTPSATNLAGDLRLRTSGTLQVAKLVGDEILVLSSTDAFRMRYTGQPFGYGQKRVGVNCGVLSPNAAVATSDFAVWMGEEGFWMYRGQIQPLPCDVWDYVYRNLNRFQRALIACGHNSTFSEVWWFFPTGDSTVNNRYVVWNYRENWWSVGVLGRSVWMDKGVWDFPVAAGVGNNVHEHEVGFSAVAQEPRPRPFIESSPVTIGSGDRLAVVNEILPDQEGASLDALEYEFVARMNPRTDPITFGPFRPDATGYTPVRFTGREIMVRVRANIDTDWRLGVLRANVIPGSRK